MQNSIGRESLDAPRSGLGSWVLIGAMMGILAGLVFATFQIIMAVAALGPPPMELLLMVGGVPFGGEPATTSLAPAIAIASTVHLVLSAIYGAVLGAVASKVRAVRNNSKTLVGAATVYGLLIWIVNFYVIAPAAFPWFTQTNQVVQFFAHTFFYGTVLGLLLAFTRSSARTPEGVRASG